MQYLQLNVRCDSGFSDVLIAELAEIGFDVFEENKSGFSAFAEEEKLDFDACKELLEGYAERTALSYGIQKVARENWNKEWESHYPPVVVNDSILIRTDFHQVDRSYPFEIRINPKMSFGTGHHPTTSQMLAFLQKYPPSGKRVLDAGCGTGILGIMAEKLGASSITGFDNDPWCIENSEENFRLNDCLNCRSVLASGIIEVFSEPVECILANINKNIILRELPDYSACLENGGLLLLSGFYSEDAADILQLAEKFGLVIKDRSETENWCCLVLEKTSS
jgi:ribosomal protein L11 methyltransferase